MNTASLNATPLMTLAQAHHLLVQSIPTARLVGDGHDQTRRR